jgi:hypothetical protein
MNVSQDLKAYFDFTFSRCFALCDYCGSEQPFASSAQPHSEEWYLDMAVALKEARWVVPEVQMAA